MAGYIVGQNYHNVYWRKDYKVLAVDGLWVTIEWEDGTQATHCTDLGDDKPFDKVCPIGDRFHGCSSRNRSNNWGKDL